MTTMELSRNIQVFLFISIVSNSLADIGVDLNKLKSQYLSEDYTRTNFTMDDIKDLLYKKCKKGGVTDPQILSELEKASLNLIQCASEIANLTVILEEIEMARPRGELDEVFEKYCNKQPQAERCLHDFNRALLPCLTVAERTQNVVIMKIISSLLSFICYKNGDQIAMFIAEEGPECLEDNKENISNCMNATFAAYMPKEGHLPELTDIPELVIGPKQCIDLYDFEECVLSYLEKCNEITPANIIESMFRYVKNETKCQPEIDKNKQLILLAEHARNSSKSFTPLNYLLLSVSVIFYNLS